MMTGDAADRSEEKPIGHGGVSFGFSIKRSTSALVPHRTDPEKDKDFVSEIDDRCGIKSSKNPKITKKELLVIPCPGNTAASAATSAAAEEILKESREWLEKGPDDVTKKKNEGLVVRLSGPELDSDLMKRPETSTLDDYEAVPVDGFGMGMLRGMGFNPAEGIGGFKKAAVKCIEPDVRPKGLGLGAGRPKNSSNVTVKSLVSVEAGTYKGICGLVEAVDGESARVIVKTTDGRSINVSENAVKIADKLPEAPVKKEKVKRKRSPSPDRVPWVQPLLRVRLIEESSKYYNSKVIVDDVIGKRRCVVRTESGRVLDEVDPLRDCETLVPKAGGRVMVVRGRRKGDVGQIIDKDKRKGMAAVRIGDRVLKLDFDDVCEFVGDSHDDDF